MPLYDYRCRECDSVFEVKLTLEEKGQGVTPSCPQCKSTKVVQAFSPVGYIRQRSLSRDDICGQGCGGCPMH
ncbi:MAG: zinc ribbon domain-containing protein [Firmicutes bacterium]|jgi:putative FmdB family regulatory protein|nr:zinc ribbon domain-containing protein [Bacillota bacterium]